MFLGVTSATTRVPQGPNSGRNYLPQEDAEESERQISTKTRFFDNLYYFGRIVTSSRNIFYPDLQPSLKLAERASCTPL